MDWHTRSDRDPTDWNLLDLQAGIRDLERIRRQTDAASAVLVAAMPDDRDAAARLARAARISNREARRRRDVAKVVDKVPGALELLSKGTISPEHVGSLAPVVDKPGVVALLAKAKGTSPEEFATEVRNFEFSGEHGDDIAKRQRALRLLRFFNGPHGTIGLSGHSPAARRRDVEGETRRDRRCQVARRASRTCRKTGRTWGRPIRTASGRRIARSQRNHRTGTGGQH